MGQIKQLAFSFRRENMESFVDEVINKLLYDNGSVESDLLALIAKSADLCRQGATYHSLIHNHKEYTIKMKEIITQLSYLNSFLEYIANAIPHRKKIIQDTIEANTAYIQLHSHH